MTPLKDGLHEIAPGKVPMVVTHLEMLSPANGRDVMAPEGVTFQKITASVADYRTLFDHIGSDWLWYGRRLLDDQSLNEILQDPRVEIYTLRQAGRDEAILELDFREDAACELSYFGVSAPLVGTGAGRYLMNQAVHLAWSKPIRRFRVHTCTIDSPKALGFYMRSGFTPYKRQIEIADDPRLLGIIPKTKGQHVPIIE
ncbi:MAG: GNAT family N-acetyltransferase [Pseudomonadota bacterium]